MFPLSIRRLPAVNSYFGETTRPHGIPNGVEVDLPLIIQAVRSASANYPVIATGDASPCHSSSDTVTHARQLANGASCGLMLSRSVPPVAKPVPLLSESINLGNNVKRKSQTAQLHRRKAH